MCFKSFHGCFRIRFRLSWSDAGFVLGRFGTAAPTGSWQQPDTPRCSQDSQMLSVCFRHSQIFPDTPKYSQMTSDTSRYSQTLLNTPRCSHTLPDTPRYSRILPDALRRFQTVPDIPEYSQMLLTNNQPTKQTTKQSNQHEKQAKEQSNQRSAGAFWSILRAFWSVSGDFLDVFELKQKSAVRAMIFLGAAKPNRARRHQN